MSDEVINRHAAVMLGALIKIAAFGTSESITLAESGGGYGGFDEPASVAIAREALTEIGHIASPEQDPTHNPRPDFDRRGYDQDDELP